MGVQLLALLIAAAPGIVFVDGAQAEQMLEDGAIVLDARKDAKTPYLPNARALDWLDLRDGIGRTGRLAATDEMVRALEARGVSDRQAVLVYGDADRGWGEEARIWWMLRYLGHDDVRILDGGIRRWRLERRRTAKALVEQPKRGSLVPKIDSDLRADHQRVNRTRKMPLGQVLDVRTPEEFGGATPYWAFRGGHVPGAKLVPWTTLMQDGRVLPRERLRKRIEGIGLTADRPTVAYCTGGVRSAFAVAVLVEAGFENVANYDGSWWEWSGRADLPVE